MFTKDALLANSLNISPITGERLRPVIASRNPTEVIYSISKEEDSLNGISNADIIYEFIDTNGKLYYKALFHENVPKKTHPIVSINSKSYKALPKLNFLDYIDLPKDYTRSANSIYVTFNYNLFSNFLYDKDQYIHFRDSEKDIDKSNSKPIGVSNVVVQFAGSNCNKHPENINGYGHGLLFCGGKAIDIKWEKNNKNPLKLLDESGNPLSLLRGKTWWIVVKDNSFIAYN
jgi:hypothetical protein